MDASLCDELWIKRKIKEEKEEDDDEEEYGCVIVEEFCLKVHKKGLQTSLRKVMMLQLFYEIRILQSFSEAFLDKNIFWLICLHL